MRKEGIIMLAEFKEAIDIFLNPVQLVTGVIVSVLTVICIYVWDKKRNRSSSKEK